MATFLTLPPHLLAVINDLLKANIELPDGLRDPLSEATSQQMEPAALEVDEHEIVVPEQVADVGHTPPAVLERPPPPTIALEVIERLSQWAINDPGRSMLKSKGIDPSRYSSVALLCGTEVYISPHELSRLRAAEVSDDKPNPYLPLYLSPAPPSIGSEYRNLSRTLSTAFNILFSIIGSAVAVYVASVTGAGYSRERGIILGIIAGLIVGLADVVLVVIFMNRADQGRKERHERGRKLMTGTGVIDGSDQEGGDGSALDEKMKEGAKGKPEGGELSAPGKRIQLRRRALPSIASE